MHAWRTSRLLHPYIIYTVDCRSQMYILVVVVVVVVFLYSKCEISIIAAWYSFFLSLSSELIAFDFCLRCAFCACMFACTPFRMAHSR